MARFKIGDSAFILESNRIVREVTIIKCTGGMYLIKFVDTGGGIQVKEHRLYAAREDAEAAIPAAEKKQRNYKGHWEYDV